MRPVPNCVGCTTVGYPRAHRTTLDQSLARDPARGIRQQKKRPRPSELDRPDVQRKRATFVRWRRRIDPDRLVFLDEAGANLSMGRSHAWVKKGQVHVEPRPMNWGKNLTMIGRIGAGVVAGSPWPRSGAQPRRSRS